MPFCLSCNYPLTGLPSNTCPECGRPFDPANPDTVNAGNPVGPIARRFLKPTGFLTLLLVFAAFVLLYYSTGLPRQPWRFSSAEFNFYRSIDYNSATSSWPDFRELVGRLDIFFLIGTALAFLVLFVALIRIPGRLAVILFRRPGRALRPRFTIVRLLSRALLIGSILLLLFGWPVRLASLWIHDTDVKLPRVTLSDRDRPLIHRAGIMDLPTVELRSRALHHMILSCYPENRAILEAAVVRESDPMLRRALLALLSFHRERESLDILLHELDHPDSRVRAAATDAIGVLFAPAHAVESEQAILLPTSSPSEPITCSLEPFFRTKTGQMAWSYPGPRLDSTQRPMPADLRERLTQRMLSAPTPEERQAAARALVPHRPADYQLRIAEWGVWLAAGDKRSIARAIDDIPPFVHRTGNPAAEFNQRIRPSFMIVNKPVIHITASKPLVLDLEVLIRQGRPWFAYPRPDDFTIEVVQASTPLADGIIQAPASRLVPLDNSRIPFLTDLHEGYPFVTPGHRFHDSDPHWGLRPVGEGLKVDAIHSLGLRWQSLIISPSKLPWMTLPDVGPDPRFGWWSSLREVPCSYISNRNESERFLYYDGPSLFAQPVAVHRASPDGPLHFEVSPPTDAIAEEIVEFENRGTPLPKHPSDRREYRVRHGLAIHVANDGGLTIHRHTIPRRSGAAPFASSSTFKSEQAISHFLELLRDAGLSELEANGLLTCWRKEFFQTPGSRFLLMISPEDYDRACPLRCSLPPTSITRVGLIVTQF